MPHICFITLLLKECSWVLPFIIYEFLWKWNEVFFWLCLVTQIQLPVWIERSKCPGNNTCKNTTFLEYFTHFSAFLTYLCLTYRMICLTLQNKASIFLFVEAISISGEHSLKVSYQVIVARGQISRIKGFRKQLEIQFMQFCHSCNRLVARWKMKEHFFFFTWGH